MKIAWGITGAGHLLRQSIDIIEKILENVEYFDLFLSSAAETVLSMYNLNDRIEELHNTYSDIFKSIYRDKEQNPGYPVCARFNLHHYDLLVLSPLTANSVAKINVGIADTLITNIFAQMIKGSGTIFAVPCDLISGEVETEIPGGDIIKIHIDEFNSQNARLLLKFPRLSIFESPNKLFNAIQEKIISRE